MRNDLPIRHLGQELPPLQDLLGSSAGEYRE